MCCGCCWVCVDYFANGEKSGCHDVEFGILFLVLAIYNNLVYCGAKMKDDIAAH